MKIKKVEARPDFPAFENKVLEFWESDQTFQKSLDKNKGQGKEIVFYDGPPFPTGNPHHGTIFVSILKDVVPRYLTMRGNYVPRGWGWDCHGLPIETLAEKQLGIKEKREIETTLGVAKFNDQCRKIVSDFNESWKIYIDKLGRWVDFDHPYRTLDCTFMESVIWSFAECYKKNLIYKDYRVTPYCFRCETPLSVSDTRLDDSTRPKQDRAITVPFQSLDNENVFYLAWTTTPWTLPSNLALAVGEEIDYVTVALEDKQYILAKELLSSYKAQLGKKPEILAEQKGKDLLGKGYKPLFSYFKNENPNGFKILSADFVSTGDGTGIVHMAPAFGEDDYWTCRNNDISVIAPVDEKGCFTDQVVDFAGKNVHEANPEIVRFLKDQGKVFADGTIEHNYPHCWRCRNPLIYKAVDAWYFSVEKIKDNLLKNNQKIAWKPDSVQEGRFGKWLENARDWNISRNRYWATPIPVWECDSCDNQQVLESKAKLEEKAGHELNDLHKEFLDQISYPCEKCQGTMHRTPEVLDGWYESGSMPYGQYHYPFDNSEHFRSHFPSDFIVEYVGQVRGWFYYLHVLSTALFDEPAFKNCLVTGTLLAADGKKISKSQKNYTDPMMLMDTFGADALRAYLLGSASVQMADMAFKDEGVEGQLKSIHLPFWNALSFFTTYAEIDDVYTSDLDLLVYKENLKEIDRYILSELEILKRSITELMDQYTIHEATRLFPIFLDTLTNWFIRRSRNRVWVEDPRDSDKLCFYSTCFYILKDFTRLLAPICPFLAETVWQRLGQNNSVHLESWPEVDESLIDSELSERVNLTRRIISAGLSIRSREKIRVRQPLQKARIALSEDCDLSSQKSAIQDELNLKEVEFLQDESEIAERIGKPNSRALGPVFGKDTQKIIQAVKQGDFKVADNGNIQAAGFEIQPDLIEIVYQGKEGIPVESTGGAVIALDIKVTKELEIEGNARDLVRHIQELRKEADLNVADRIELQIEGAQDILSAHSDYIMAETLSIAINSSAENSFKALINKPLDLAGSQIAIQISLANDK